MKHRYLISSIFIIVVLFSLSFFAWFKPQDEVSNSERRPLASFPEITLENIISGKFTSEFEDYATDQFPFRDKWRTLKAISKFYIFNQKDNNDIYIHDSYASKLETVINDKSIENALTKMKYLYSTYVEGKTDKVYFSVIPDKSLTLAEKGGYPSLDYEELQNRFERELSWAEFIDIYPYLDYTDYYKTDTHWSQDKIVDVAEKIATSMGAEIEKDFEKVTLEDDFYGVYYGQSSLPLPPDKITYLTSPIIENAVVYNYEGTNGNINDITPSKVYDMKKLSSKDPYEMFLSGASYLERIKNPSNTSGRKLIIFRDSYTSSLAPLLLKDYSEIVLVDIRYVFSQAVGSLVTPDEFEGADVLFLYSALILNDSFLFR